MDNWLDNHGCRVHPGQGHEHGEGPGNGNDEPVLNVAGVGHLLESDAGQWCHVASCVDADDSVLHQVLEIGKPIIQILVVNPWSPPWPRPAEPVLHALGAVHLVSVNTDLVSEELGQFSGIWRNTWAFRELDLFIVYLLQHRQKLDQPKVCWYQSTQVLSSQVDLHLEPIQIC